MFSCKVRVSGIGLCKVRGFGLGLNPESKAACKIYGTQVVVCKA